MLDELGIRRRFMSMLCHSRTKTTFFVRIKKRKSKQDLSRGRTRCTRGIVKAGAVDGDCGGGLRSGLVCVVQVFDERTLWDFGRRRRAFAKQKKGGVGEARSEEGMGYAPRNGSLLQYTSQHFGMVTCRELGRLVSALKFEL